ncbi:FkbM family methyltransferase [Parabacteroides sp. 52]|uniref:FkbM family methyltransferase n=1 Tax=unclassified Parabacteroides TaxID=2649774 RepID=UPI0013D36B89|nr:MULTISPECIES: FkbM family methyltransferase [unclassified Parabacteroides]MDH6534232.1 FkbM family methyltransferase [Parabacteroides sp. PM5-20]NDV55384.1 FkbM family methyltransferase [Parabacteroides sp. 52]
MNFLKKGLRSCLRAYGYDIVKVYKKKTVKGMQILKIGDIRLQLPAEHALPSLISQFPGYSRNLPRIVQCIQKKYPDTAILDVGANVGDTVALIKEKCKGDPVFICVEGDPLFITYLRHNLGHLQNVKIVDCFLSDNTTLCGTIINQEGTARIATDTGSKQMNLLTLDALSESEIAVKQAKILKIDTDGFDLKIIRGGLNYIKEIKPILFFEYDRVFLDANGDDGFSTLLKLKDLGYEDVIIYDNYGRMLLSFHLYNMEIFEQLDLYIKGKKAAFEYFDICLFHKEDADLYNDIKTEEIKLMQ